jgi:protein-S-isoprenylcysteine O-methyltransferase Ste14
MPSPLVAVAVLWSVFLASFLVSHLHTRRQRSAASVRPERHIHHNPAARWGGLLQFAGICVVFAVREPSPEAGLWISFGAYGLAAVSLGVTWAALKHLGRQWRLAAVVAEDQQLITTGPYAVLRHPIYTALLGILLATALLIARWPHALAGLALYLIGAEIRARAEESVLLRAFGDQYRDYKRRTYAFLPWIR